tara:strand:+ start:21 stop:320 length:300 start_codon:yes stop_codon:yes gene_type:complete
MAQKQYANKRDINESQIIKDLITFGASVIPIDKWDLVVGHEGVTHLMEVKNPEQDWSVTPAQRKIINNWKGSPLHIITNSEQAINILKRATMPDREQVK